MKFLYPEYVLWENGEIYSGFVLFILDSGKISKIQPIDRVAANIRNKMQFLKGLLIPGMVNAHCHLELSWLNGSLANGLGMEEFFRNMKGVHVGIPEETDVFEMIQNDIRQMYNGGVQICADISNTALSYLAKEHSPLLFHTFVEVFEKDGMASAKILASAESVLSRFSDSEKNTASLSLHTLFTSSVEFMKEVMKIIAANKNIHSIHFMESNEEKLFFSEKRPLKYIHEKHKPEFISDRPAEIAAEVLPENQRVLFVHNTYCNERDIIEVNDAFSDAWFCLCPASNKYINDAIPPLPEILKHSENIVLGTDSLASNSALNMFSEMQILLDAFPFIEPGDLLKMATINGAKLLGLDRDYGSISPGKKPGLIQLRDYNPNRRNILFQDIRRII